MKPDTTPSSTRGGFLRGLSLAAAVALVVGNMVGTSVHTLPATLAKVCGPLGVLAWPLTAAGYLFVALVYAELGPRFPRTGGPYVFAREAFGELAGFLVTWSYWISATVGNAAIALAVVGYLAGFAPVLGQGRVEEFATAQVLVWGLTLLNVLGVRQGGRLQVAVMVLNIVPLLAFSALALTHFEPENLRPFAPHTWAALPAGAAMIVWAYSGIESATVPAEEMAGGARTIRRGTMIGYALGTLAFLAAALAVAGVMPNDVLAQSKRPVAEAAARVGGIWAERAIGFAAIAAGLGTLNGWILMSGRIPVSAARDGIFFESLGRIHPRFRTPHVALLVGGAIASAMLFLALRHSMLETFHKIVGFSVLLTLLPHLSTAAAQLFFARSDPRASPGRMRAQLVAGVAFAFTLFVIYGVGPEVALWGLLAVLAGIPVYVAFKTRTSTPG